LAILEQIPVKLGFPRSKNRYYRSFIEKKILSKDFHRSDYKFFTLDWVLREVSGRNLRSKISLRRNQTVTIG